jgi:hypothetical protein
MLFLIIAGCLGSSLEGQPPIETPPIIGEEQPIDDDVVDRWELLGIDITPADPVLDEGDFVQLVVKAYYDDDTTADVTDDVVFEAADARVVTIFDNTVQAIQAGESDVTATLDGATSATITVTVIGEDVKVTGYRIEPTSIELNIGDDVQLSTYAQFSDGTEGNVSGRCVWESNADSIAGVDISGSVEAISEGTAEITGTCDGTALKSTITVLPDDVAPELPDLHVKSFTAAISGDQVVYTVTIENLGNGVASGFFADLWLHKDSAPSTGDGDYDDTEYTASLNPGSEETFTMTLSAVVAGTHTSWITVDNDGWIDEDDESNNNGGPLTVNINAALLGPNLEITGFEGQTDTASVHTMFTVEVTNTGDEPATDFYIDLYYDLTASPGECAYGDDFTSIVELLPGESTVWEPEVFRSPGRWGHWETWIYADTCDDVEESNELDNIDAIELGLP